MVKHITVFFKANMYFVILAILPLISAQVTRIEKCPVVEPIVVSDLGKVIFFFAFT